jgi:predicted RNase H-like HicB family nuclease
MLAEKYHTVKEHIFEVVIEPDEDVYHAYCPILRGCHTWGHTEAEAFKYIQEAVTLHLKAMIDDREAIPGIGVIDNIEHLKLIFEVKEPDKE